MNRFIEIIEDIEKCISELTMALIGYDIEQEGLIVIHRELSYAYRRLEDLHRLMKAMKEEADG